MARESVAELLEIRFGNRPSQILTWLNQLTDVPTLKLLHKQSATAQSTWGVREVSGIHDSEQRRCMMVVIIQFALQWQKRRV